MTDPVRGVGEALWNLSSGSLSHRVALTSLGHFSSLSRNTTPISLSLPDKKGRDFFDMEIGWN